MKFRESKTRSAKEIDFDADLLVQTLRDHADHLKGKKQLTLRVTNLVLPPRIKSIRPRDIVGIRQKLKVSQPVFAALLNVPVATARSWEQGKRRPSGAALRLLALARERPNTLLAA